MKSWVVWPVEARINFTDYRVQPTNAASVQDYENNETINFYVYFKLHWHFIDIYLLKCCLYSPWTLQVSRVTRGIPRSGYASWVSLQNFVSTRWNKQSSKRMFLCSKLFMLKTVVLVVFFIGFQILFIAEKPIRMG